MTDIIAERLAEMGDLRRENERLRAVNVEMLAALKALVANVLDYEKINNLSPAPGKRDCWQSVTQARAAIAKAGP